jgi:phosphatidylglycerol:prolipoprotein diacylglycerol transferase
MQQVLFRIPIGAEGIPVYGFGMMLFCAFIGCIWMARRRAARVGIDGTVIEDLALWCFLGGILGARLCYLILHRGLQNVQGIGDFLGRLVAIWDGGIILYGAFLGGTLSYFVGWFVTLRNRKNVTTLRICDIVAPTIALGLIFGRVGCFLNGCCYGQVACESCPGIKFPLSAPARHDLVAAGLQTPAGFLIDERIARVSHIDPDSDARRRGLEVDDLIVKVNGMEVKTVKVAGEEGPSSGHVAQLLTELWPRGVSDLTLTVERGGKSQELPTMVPRTVAVLPTQLFESISMILVLIVVLTFDSVKRREGQGMALMMICYGIHRTVNEILRIDQRPVGFEQYVSYLVIGGGIVMMGLLALKKQPDPVPT